MSSMTRRLYVFGSNGEGQLGIPAADIVNTPTIVSDPPPLEGFPKFCGGDNHTLVLTSEGEVFGVGDNRKAQLVPGPGMVSRFDTFTKIGGGFRFAAATCESSAFIIGHDTLEQSMVHTRGTGQWGELGFDNGNTDQAAADAEQPPILIALPGKVVDFAAGVWHYVAVLEDGSVYGWGKARLGQLGENLSGKVTMPTRITGLSFKPTKVVCGKDFTYLVGDPLTGEHTILGKDKFNVISDMPKEVNGYKDIGATWHAIFVLFEDGKLIAWGRNTMWELVPSGLPPIDIIAVGSEHVLAVTKGGKLISWGWAKHGNCGDLLDMQEKVENDMVSGFWNDVVVPGKVEAIGAGFCTSFIVTG
jgi:protein ATS1